MKNSEDRLTKALALSGTVFLWFPTLFTLLTSIIGSARSRMFRLDYLMPAELFPAAFVGALITVWAAFRAQAYKVPIVVSAALMAVNFGLLLLIPVATGLASGTIKPQGWPWALTILSLILYLVAMLATGVLGVMVNRALFRRPKDPS